MGAEAGICDPGVPLHWLRWARPVPTCFLADMLQIHCTRKLGVRNARPGLKSEVQHEPCTDPVSLPWPFCCGCQRGPLTVCLLCFAPCRLRVLYVTSPPRAARLYIRPHGSWPRGSHHENGETGPESGALLPAHRGGVLLKARHGHHMTLFLVH